MAAGMGRAAFAVLVFRSALLLGWMRPCAAQSAVVGPPAPLVAPLGGEVVLPCSLQPAVDVYGLTVEWARPDLRPKYVSVWRDGEELQANENPAFSGRKSLFTEELRRGNISLKLSDLRPSDQGSYRCYVPHLDRGAVVELQVVDPGSSRTAAWLAVLPVVGVLAALTALWVLWRRTRLKRKKQQDAEAGGEEPRGRPLLEGEDQQDEDRSKENSSQVQLHTVTPAAEHLDPQKPAAEHLDLQTPAGGKAGEHLDLQALRDVRQKPDAEETYEEETETGGQDGNREEQTHSKQKGGNKGGDLTTGAKIKKLFQRNSGKKADKEKEDQSLKTEGKHDESKGKKTKEKKEKKGGNKVSGVLEQTENKEKQKEELKQPLMEGEDQQDEDRSKANSSPVQPHTVTPAAEHLDPQKPAAEHLDPQKPAGEHLYPQAPTDVRQKPDAEDTHEEETETGGQDGNGAAGGGTETNQNQEEGKHGEKEEKKKQSLEQKIQQKQRDEKIWAEKVRKIEKQIEDKENQIAELEQQLKEVKIQLKNTEEDLKKTEGQTETPKEEKEKAVKALSDRRKELQKKKEEVQKMLEKPEKAIEIMKKEVDVNEARKNKATAEKTELKRELEELKEAEASSSQTEEQRTLSTHNASAGSSCSTSQPVKNLKAEMMEFRLSS
ncbi:uncharacterized protein ACNS7B_021210 [Menidia menidia]